MGVCLTVFWAMRTPLRIGPNRSRCCNFIPSAAKLAQAVNWLVGFVVDSFMMMVLLSQVFFPLIGKIHHRSFRKSLCFDSSLSLFWTKFRLLTTSIENLVFRSSKSVTFSLLRINLVGVFTLAFGPKKNERRLGFEYDSATFPFSVLSGVAVISDNRQSSLLGEWKIANARKMALDLIT